MTTIVAIAAIILLFSGAHGYHMVYRLAPERLTLLSAAFAFLGAR